jgi:predicted nucleotidyltransferase
MLGATAADAWARRQRIPPSRAGLEPALLAIGLGSRYRSTTLANSSFPEWSRRDEAARQSALALAERVQSRRRALEAIFAECGVREAYLFGSVARGEARATSDVDIAVAGCPPDALYRLGSKLERVIGVTLDLVDLDIAPAEFAGPIRALGQRLYPPVPATGLERASAGLEDHDEG